MRTRARLSLVVGLAISVVLGAQGQSPSTASKTEGVSSPPPYRLLQLVSVGRTAEKINEAAAAGYRFLMLQPTPGAAGVTVLMKRVEDSTAAYQYKFVVSEPGKDRLHRALNQAASGGFRLVADSLLFGPAQPRDGELLLWPAGAEKKQYSQTYVAVMENAPGTSASYEYRVSSALRTLCHQEGPTRNLQPGIHASQFRHRAQSKHDYQLADGVFNQSSPFRSGLRKDPQ